MTKDKTVQSITESPWNFACQWYQVEEVQRCIELHRDESQLGEPLQIPEDIYSPEFAEWLTEQYRLAMRKGAELAIAEMKDKPCVHDLVRQFNSDDNLTSDY